MYNQDKTTEEKLKKFAADNFKSRSLINGRQLLTIFLNESDQTDVKDFIISRNPEFALNLIKYKKVTSEDDNLESEFASKWNSEAH